MDICSPTPFPTPDACYAAIQARDTTSSRALFYRRYVNGDLLPPSLPSPASQAGELYVLAVCGGGGAGRLSRLS